MLSHVCLPLSQITLTKDIGWQEQMVNDCGRKPGQLAFLPSSFFYLSFYIIIIIFLTLARMPSRSADWKIGCLLNWRHHRKLGRLQIANLRPEQKLFFPFEGTAFFPPLHRMVSQVLLDCDCLCSCSQAF